MMPTYSVVGLGKLGSSIAAAIASRGFHVIGVDSNPRAVDLVNAGRAPVHETDLEQTIVANRKYLKASHSFEEAVLGSHLTFVAVPTPSDESGAFSLQQAARAFQGIGRALREKNGYHNVVLTSTVLPGATRHGLLPILERESGKTCGSDFGLCFSPAFIALGNMIRGFLHPDFTLIGEFDDRCGGQLEACYSDIMPEQPPCRRMNLENAELTKISLNSFITTKIVFANMIGDCCERIPGGDVDVVTDALGLDERIGAKCLTAALGYGGPCFPRDNEALAFFGQAIGAPSSLPTTTDWDNRARVERIVGRLRPMIESGTTVAVLGLAYKPFSSVVEESQSIDLVRSLSRAGACVVGYDPLSSETARGVLGEEARIVDSISECLVRAKVVLVTTPDPAFRTLSMTDFDQAPARIIVVDFWRILDREIAEHPRIDYIPVGRSIDDLANTARLAKLWASVTDVDEAG